MACVAFGFATAASVFAGTMAVAQSTDAGIELVAVRTMYAGHDGAASCPGIAEVAAEVGDRVTYCYELTNRSASAIPNVDFVDAATGAEPANMTVVAGAVPLAAKATVVWAFETEALAALSGPTPTATATPPPTATAVPAATSVPAATVAAAATATPDPTATATPAPTSTPEPTAVPAAAAAPDPTAVPAATATPDPTAVPAATATPADDTTALPIAPSAPAPPAAASESSLLDSIVTASAAGDVSDEAATPSMAADATSGYVVVANDRTTRVPIATSSGWRLGNTTAAMVMSVLIAVSAGIVAGVAFWRLVTHLQRRRSALYWYQRLAITEDAALV